MPSRVVGLGGGIGAARVWRVLRDAVGAPALTVVANTGDDLWMHGLRICPDVDTTLYALSGLQDRARGWGRRDESFRCMGALRELGEDVWFHLGDLDLATHLLRTGLLRAGVGLTDVTQRLATAVGVRTVVLPMTEQEVSTRLETSAGLLHYEEYLVREHAAPRVHRVVHEGLAEAEPAPGVLAAIAGAELVVLAPSNPVASLAPILGVPGVREAVRATAAPVVAVSPIVSRVPIDDAGERARAVSRTALLAAVGVPATATGAASLYADLCGRFVLDVADAEEAGPVAALGMEPVVAETLLHRGADPAALLDAVLARA